MEAFSKSHIPHVRGRSSDSWLPETDHAISCLWRSWDVPRQGGWVGGGGDCLLGYLVSTSQQPYLRALTGLLPGQEAGIRLLLENGCVGMTVRVRSWVWFQSQAFDHPIKLPPKKSTSLEILKISMAQQHDSPWRLLQQTVGLQEMLIPFPYRERWMRELQWSFNFLSRPYLGFMPLLFWIPFQMKKKKNNQKLLSAKTFGFKTDWQKPGKSHDSPWYIKQGRQSQSERLRSIL